MPATGSGLGDWLTDAAARGFPLRVTLPQLVQLPVVPRAERVFVCENPAVLRQAVARLGPAGAPLVCTEGVAGLLAAARRGPPRAVQTSPGATTSTGPGSGSPRRPSTGWGARPWRMGADDYAAALAGGDTEPLRGEPAASPWDPALATALAVAGRSVMEERLVSKLVEDLAWPDHRLRAPVGDGRDQGGHPASGGPLVAQRAHCCYSACAIRH